MLQSERKTTLAVDLGGQGSTTEPGESPMEAKHRANGVVQAQTPSSAKDTGPAKQEKELESSKGAGVTQQPTLPDGGNTSASCVSEVPRLGGSSGLVHPTQSTLKAMPSTSSGSVRKKHAPIAASLGASSQPRMPIPVIATPAGTPAGPVTVARATPSRLAASVTAATEMPLLALGQAAANQKTRPLVPQAAQPQSMLQIPAASPPPVPPKPKSLRRGKWTVEEEAYVARVIQDFNSGFLNAPAGTTLRSYLSEKLQCDPMRITKKFTGDACIGKRVFHPAVRNPSNAAAIDKAQAELDALERRWRRRLEMQQRESAKKAAASAAAAAAASGRSHGFITQNAMGTVLGRHNATSSNGVTQTASWLDRASHILKGADSYSGVPVQQKFSLTQEQAQALESLPKKEIEMQMKEVERLIHEGPIIQQTTAGFPLILHQSPSTVVSPPAPPVPTTIVASTPMSPPSDGQQTPPEPADKRMRTGAEDAEALVGFLTAVRASAAAGTDSFK